MVAELYQGSIAANAIVNNDPNLRPEKSWTSELSGERVIGSGSLRLTAFFEDTVDALYSQTNVTVTPNVTNIQNVDEIATRGPEAALTQPGLLGGKFRPARALRERPLVGVARRRQRRRRRILGVPPLYAAQLHRGARRQLLAAA